MNARTAFPRAQALGTGSEGVLYAATLDADGIVLGHASHHDGPEMRAWVIASGQTVITPAIYAVLRANLAQRWSLASGVPVAVAPDPVRLAIVARRGRNERLNASDHLFVGDAPAATLATLPAWRSYRQALRDLPAQPGFPQTITWPTPPA